MHGRKPASSPEERFWAQVDQCEDGCWYWLGGLHCEGYGRITVYGKRTYAHRFAYELLVGKIPEGLEIDHLCRNRACVNPTHLEPVTCEENVLRGVSPSAVHRRQTHCVHGHPFDVENTGYMPDGRRRCRTCDRVRARARLAAKRLSDQSSG